MKENKHGQFGLKFITLFFPSNRDLFECQCVDFLDCSSFKNHLKFFYSLMLFPPKSQTFLSDIYLFVKFYWIRVDLKCCISYLPCALFVTLHLSILKNPIN